MLRNMMGSKIHRAKVTDVNLNYEGSISICPKLMDEAGIAPYEQVHVLNVNNGSRIVTYAIPADDGGEICINGAAAHFFNIDDIVIIISYRMVDDREGVFFGYKPVVVRVDNNEYNVNRARK